MEIIFRSLLASCVIISSLSWGQTNFNTYIPIVSKGVIPADFTKETFQKVKEELREGRNELNRSQEKVFLKGTNYAIDELLHSGLVVYGDPISEYVSSVAAILLKDDKKTLEKLRFYTLKSNVANAFSTDQGILFVTTGLIMQLSSEAELAFVLAHEIAHYQLGHVVETFDWKTKNSTFGDQIEHLSQYVQEHELEADNAGLNLYYNAGYSEKAVSSTFDVLMYSYLPFEERPFSSSYFNTPVMYVPETMFPTKIYPITAIEDYDDENSSHPNIKRRKSALDPEILKRTNWQHTFFKLGEERFASIRSIARFEAVRLHILDVEYAEALYAIYILEKDYPESIYLHRMKSHAWLNFMMYKNGNISNKTVKKESELEGESAKLHAFLKKLSKDGVNTLALRTIYDSHKKFPTDEELKALQSKLLEHLVQKGKFSTGTYSLKSFDEAAKEALSVKKDTIPSASSTGSGSKYERIKKSKIGELPESFDSTRFYLYGIRDILADSSFLNKYNTQLDIKAALKKEADALDEMTRKERKAYDKRQLRNVETLSSNELIVVEPSVISYKRGSIDYVKSEKLERIFSESIESAAELTGIKSYSIDSRTLTEKGTAGYNERSILMTLLNQLSIEEDIEVFPLDFQQLQDIKRDYGTTNVMFSLVEHSYSSGLTFQGIFSSIFVYPVLLVYVPVSLLTGNHTEITALFLDLDSGTIQRGVHYYFKDTPKKWQLGAHMFDIFTKLKHNDGKGE
jgi:Zn-dependent protease with chaperone function